MGRALYLWIERAQDGEVDNRHIGIRVGKLERDEHAMIKPARAVLCCFYPRLPATPQCQ